MAVVVLPDSLARLFPGAPRRPRVAGETVFDVISGLNETWPGMRDRLLDGRPEIRQHIVIFVNDTRATVDTPVGPEDEVHVVAGRRGG